MCTAVALGGFMALSSMMSSGMAIQGRNAQLGAEAQVATEAARLQTQADYQQLKLRRREELTKVTVAELRRFQQGQRERGMLSAKLGDAGVYGGSTLRDTVASHIQQDIDMGTLENNFDSASAEISNQKLASFYRGQTIRNQAQTKLDSRQGAGATVLSLIGPGLGGFSQGASTFNSIKGV